MVAPEVSHRILNALADAGRWHDLLRRPTGSRQPQTASINLVSLKMTPQQPPRRRFQGN